MPDEKPKSRFRWLQPLVLAFALILGALALTLWYHSRRDWAVWTQLCAELDRDEPGWRAADVFGPESSTPAQPTLTDRVRAIHERFPHRWPNWPSLVADIDVAVLIALDPEPPTGGEPGSDAEPVPPDPPERLRDRAIGILDMPPRRPRNHLRSEVERKYWSLAIPEPLVAECHGLIDSPPTLHSGQWTRPLFLNLLPNVQSARSLARLLSEHARLQAENGRIDEALRDVEAILAVGRSLQERSVYIDFLVETALQSIAASTAIQVVALGRASPEALESLQASFARASAEPLFRAALIGERAYVEDFMHCRANGMLTKDELDSFTNTDAPKVTGWKAADDWLHRLRGGGWRNSHMAEQVRFYTALIRGQQRSGDGQLIDPNLISKELAGMSDSAAQAVRGSTKLLEADTRRRATLNCAVAALASERFRLNSGQWPENLDELVPKYLKAVPADSFNSKQVQIRPVVGGLVIYSIGPDATDDGGDIEHLSKTDGSQPRDLGFRLYDPAHRRLQPVTP